MCVMIGFPNSSTKYTSVTSLLRMVILSFSCVMWLGLFGSLWVICINMRGGRVVVFTVCAGFLYIKIS